MPLYNIYLISGWIGQIVVCARNADVFLDDNELSTDPDDHPSATLLGLATEELTQQAMDDPNGWCTILAHCM